MTGKWKFSILMALFACGGAEEEVVVEPERSSGAEHVRRDSVPSGVEVEGLMGTISQAAVSRSMDANVGRFFQCFANRSADVNVLSGRILFGFRVRTDGTVRWVIPRESSLGDRETERCMLDVARRMTFARPHGGEAEFTFPLEMDAPSDIRPALAWPSSAIASQVEQNRGQSVDCGSGPYEVTLYIGRGGSVLAAGVAVATPEQEGELDCVAELVKGWPMPDPGSYPAKVSFAL